MAALHRQNFGFDWDPANDQGREAADTLAAADAWNRVEKALGGAITCLRAADPATAVPDLTVLLVVGDPTRAHFVDEVQGVSGFGGISGCIAITVRPTPLVLNRLEAIAVHGLHHNVRYAPGGIVWDPMTVTVGEHVVSGGLADVFAAELYGDAGCTHFVSEETRTDDQVLAKVATGLDVTGMPNFTVRVHGDAGARLFGTEPLGLPTGAGYSAGAWRARAGCSAGACPVRAYLDATGSTAARSVRTPASGTLRLVTSRLGLSAGRSEPRPVRRD
ncbi:DUF2268 domain-containing protein [Streptomyces sp. NPDC079020]|uniref:DUF2268 domain-containing protein n=1 Tax=Streptomyces sp. NPDC079020 TaxID=3365722 RepID=UPI0037D822B0